LDLSSNLYHARDNNLSHTHVLAERSLITTYTSKSCPTQ